MARPIKQQARKLTPNLRPNVAPGIAVSSSKKAITPRKQSKGR